MRESTDDEVVEKLNKMFGNLEKPKDEKKVDEWMREKFPNLFKKL